MDIFKARINEPNPLGKNFGVERDKNYADPISVPLNTKKTYSVGEEVVCLDLDGTPIILGSVPSIYSRSNPRGVEEINGVSLKTRSTPHSSLILDSKFSRVGEFSSSGPEVPNSLPGDDEIVSSSGNSIRALSGGLNVMDSGSARITTNSVDGSVDIDCSQFRLNTSMGDLSIEPESNGAFSLSFKGNVTPADINPNLNPSGEPVHNIKVKIGNELEVVSGNGFGIKVDPSGKITLLGTSLFLQQGEVQVPIAGGPEDDKDIVDTRSRIIKSTAENGMESTSKGDRKDNTGGDHVNSVGKRLFTTINGPNPVQDPTILANPAGSYTKQETILSGGSKTTVGSPISGGGKYKTVSHGDIHFSGIANNRGGAAVVIDPSSAPSPVANGLWNTVNTSKFDLRTSVLPSTPDLPVDGLPNPWAFAPPIPGGINPTLTGYVKYSQYQINNLPWYINMNILLGTLSSVVPLVTATNPAGGAAMGAALPGAIASLVAKQALLFTEETKSSYISELPV